MALTTIPVELLTLDDGVTITVDDNSAALTIVSTDADASVSYTHLTLPTIYSV